MALGMVMWPFTGHFWAKLQYLFNCFENKLCVGDRIFHLLLTACSFKFSWHIQELVFHLLFLLLCLNLVLFLLQRFVNAPISFIVICIFIISYRISFDYIDLFIRIIWLVF